MISDVRAVLSVILPACRVVAILEQIREFVADITSVMKTRDCYCRLVLFVCLCRPVRYRFFAFTRKLFVR